MAQPRRAHSGDVRVSAPGAHASPALTLATLYRDHADFVWRAVLRLGIAEAQAEDAAHEVFLVAGRKLESFRHDAAPKTWLYGIARGVCANLRRSRQRSERRLALVDPPTEARPPDDELARRDAAGLVHRFVAALPDKQSAVFVLIDIEGMSGPDVAQSLGVPLGSVYSRLRLARQRFERFVSDQTGERTGQQDECHGGTGNNP